MTDTAEDLRKRAAEAKQALAEQGISVAQWAAANKFCGALVWRVLAGRSKCMRGQSHKIAVALGMKPGSICTDPGKALERRAA